MAKKTKRAAAPPPVALGARGGIRQATLVCALAVSPDGTQVATGDAKGRARVFDAATGACVFEVAWHHRDRGSRHGIQRVAFSPDGRLVSALTGINGHGALCVAELAAATTRFETADEVSSYAFAPDGQRIAAVIGTVLAIVDARDGTVSERVKLPAGTRPERVAWTTDGTAIVASCYDPDTQQSSKVLVIDAETLAVRTACDVGIDVAGTALACAPDGTVVGLDTGHGERAPRVVRLAPATGKHRIGPVADEVGRYGIVVDGRFALFRGDDRARIVDLATGAIAHELPADTRLAALSADGGVVATAHGVAIELRDHAWQPRSGAAGLSTVVAAIGFCGDTVVTGDDTNVRSWRRDGTPVATIADGDVWAIAPDGRSALLRRDDRALVVEVPSGKPRKGDVKMATAMSPDGKMVASRGGSSDAAHVVVLATGKRVDFGAPPGTYLYGLAFAPDGKSIATGTWTGTIAVQELATSKDLARNSARRSDGQQALSFSPDGKWLASGDHRRTVRLWQLPGGKLVREMTGHRRTPILATAFSPDGKLLASGDEADVRLWHVKTGKPAGVVRMAGHSLAFSPDGTLLAIGGNGEAMLYDVAALVT